jgi:mono/diheme cytochrome c family protein
MSEQTNQSSELPWGKRPVSARDMVIMVGVIVLACIGTAILTIYVVQNQPRAAPVTLTTAQSAVSSSQAAAQSSAGSGDGQAIFQQFCIACHSIGAGIVVGPDLEGVTTRRDRAWLARWIAEPDKMLAESDPIATELFQEFNNIPMTNLGLSTADVEALLIYLDNPGGVVASSPAAVTLPPGDSARGEAVFTGATGLQNGAPACISCHSTAGIGSLGGGTLGPDLTNVQERYGEVGLPQTLQNLPFPTMRGVFGEKPLTNSEVADLYAYFARANQATAGALNYIFVLIGLVGFLVLLLISHLLWRKRLKEVRKPLLGEVK